MKIGIIGLGFVGDAIRSVYEDLFIELVLIDKDKTKGKNSYSDLEGCEGVFVCVPTPQGEDGVCDTGILVNVLENLKGFEGVIISKCTAPPSVYKALNKKYRNLVHAPEFLTAANAVRDYHNGSFAFIGGSVKAYLHEAATIIKEGQRYLKDEKIIFCTIEEAALAKYTVNSFLATKVTFMNEIYKLAEKAGMDYNKISNMVQLDHRIGTSHMQVPGPDGSFGFGGMCFPKDTSALIAYAEQQGIQMSILNAAVEKNTLLRLTSPK